MGLIDSTIPGYLYQWLFNFGQSLWRSIALISLTWFVMYVLTTGNLSHYDLPKSECPEFSQNIGILGEYGARYTGFTAIPFYSSYRKSQQIIRHCLFNDDVVPHKYKGFELFQVTRIILRT